MSSQKFIMTVLIWAISFGLIACSNKRNGKSPAKIAAQVGASEASNLSSASMTDSLALQDMYTRAIAEFIKAAYQNDKTTYDTLYFGKHVYGQPEDFPDIELPRMIEDTEIRIVTPEVGQTIQLERKSLVYVNMMGWIDESRAEFLLVVFSNHAQHQYDYMVNFAYNTSSKRYELDHIAFEDYLKIERQKPKRVDIYKDGQYVVKNK